MRIVRTTYRLTDFNEYFKFRCTYEKPVACLITIFAIIAFVLSSIYFFNQHQYIISLTLFAAFLGSMACWFNYCSRKYEQLLVVFREKMEDQPLVIDFSHNGFTVYTEGERKKYFYNKINKARETSWYLFLYVGEALPIIIDKRKVVVAENTGAPVYIAKELRERCADYKMNKSTDMTYIKKKYVLEAAEQLANSVAPAADVK